MMMFTRQVASITENHFLPATLLLLLQPPLRWRWNIKMVYHCTGICMGSRRWVFANVPRPTLSHRCYRRCHSRNRRRIFKSLAYKKSSNKFCRLRIWSCRQHRCSQPGPGCSGLRFAPVPGYAVHCPFASRSPSAGEYILGWPVLLPPLYTARKEY